MRQNVVFSLVKLCGYDICIRCSKKIETVEELSYDHLQNWLHAENAIELFFDPNNIRFSHKTCNIKARSQHYSRSNTGFKGVSLEKAGGRYRATMGYKGVDGKRVSIKIGRYDTATQAAAAYDQKAVEILGEKAVTNKMLGLI